MRMKEDMKARYFDAPDLQHIGKNAYRFINAVSDFCDSCQAAENAERLPGEFICPDSGWECDDR